MICWTNGVRIILIGLICLFTICTWCLSALSHTRVTIPPLFLFALTVRDRIHRLGIGEGLPMLPYGDKFTLHRKLLAQPFSKRGCDKFLGIQTRQRKLCLQHLLKTPEDFEQHTKRFVPLPISPLSTLCFPRCSRRPTPRSVTCFDTLLQCGLMF